MEIIIIDPLKQKIKQLLERGEENPLNQARTRYGTEEDIKLLIQTYDNSKTSSYKFVFIDFSPMVRPIERINAFLEHVNTNDIRKRPVLIISSEMVLQEIDKKFLGDQFPIPIIEISIFDGTVSRVFGGSKNDKTSYKDILKAFGANRTQKGSIRKLRLPYSEKVLTDILFVNNCLETASLKDPKISRSYLAGQYYKVMDNGMLVSCYVNLKKLGEEIQAMFDVGYELILYTMNYFIGDNNPLGSIDCFVVPNNTTLFLAAIVQSVLLIPVIAIDRLGPIPVLVPNNHALISSLREKRVIVLEHVIATGNEIDRTVQFLHQYNVKIIEIISLYNLEVGKSMLMTSDKIHSICKPKNALKYEYRSRFGTSVQ